MSTTLAPLTRAKSARHTAPGLMTLDDIDALPRSLPSGDFKYELHNGRLVVMAPPGDIHAFRQARIIHDLYRAEALGLGQARGEVSLILSEKPDTVVVPDAAFILKASLPPKRSPQGYLKTLPEIVVEVRSKTDSKPAVQSKVEKYLEAGVKEVWVLDPKVKTVAIHGADGNVRVFRETETMTSMLLPGFDIPLAALFAGE